MNAAAVYIWVGIGLFCIGFYALIVHRHFLRKILALNVMGSAVFLLLVALPRPGPGPGAPPDPVSQALVITGIVVAVSATAFAIVLMVKLSATTNRPQFPHRPHGN